jgi:PAS domain S-box-containing protein
MKDGSEGRQLRKKAEKILSKKTEVPQKISSGDNEKLIHELQVHQIELEMQNDELRKAQAEIEESRSRYVELYDFAPVGYFTLDHKGLIVDANLTGASLLGVERELLSDAPFFHFIIPEDRDQFINYRRAVFQDPGRQSCELRLKSKGGNPIWVHLEGVAVEAPEGKPIRMRMAASDITERKRLEEALRRQSEKRLQDLSSKLLILHEMERKAIANEIHDGLLSELAAVKFSLEARTSTLEKTNHPAASDFRKVTNIVQKTMKEARRIMDRLRPSILDDLGLIPALDGFCRQFQELYPHIQLECKMEVREDQIPDSIKVVIYRVAQEALTNFARHGGGTLAQISLAKGSDRIEFMVQDNGRGVDLESTKRGVGLESMRERVEISGGEFRIESTPGQGTTIRATWSLSE